MHQIRGSAPDPAGGAHDAPPDRSRRRLRRLVLGAFDASFSPNFAPVCLHCVINDTGVTRTQLPESSRHVHRGAEPH